MGTDLILELTSQGDSRVVGRAIASYAQTLSRSIERTQRRLHEFEARYQTSTDYFLEQMTAEDLEGGDLEYVEWAGEAKLLQGLTAELVVLEHVRPQLP